MAGKGNNGLSQAKSAKNDEFYTQLTDIEKEMRYYKGQFKNKTVFCNCNDPVESNFFRYFAMNFNKLGLKKLIVTEFKYDSKSETQLTVFGNNSFEPVHTIEISEVKDFNHDGRTDFEDVEYYIRNNPHCKTELKSNGDFRSGECKELLQQADIVVTNPPFSLFREYMDQLIEYDKKFIILGNQNAITYKNIFPLIKDNRIWLGASIHSGDREFIVPDNYPLKAAGWKIDEHGRKVIRVKGIRWFTNLDHPQRHEGVTLFKPYNPEFYPKYDNYNAIEVSKTADIPMDYDGVMGVPITFLDKFNPDQFEILGSTQRGCHDIVPDIKKYDDYKEKRQDGSFTGSSGNKTNENANLARNDGRHNYFINSDGHIVQSCYGRLFIKRK